MSRCCFLLGLAALTATVALGAAALTPAAQAKADDGWLPLFNGKDLAGWDTWLGKPHKSVTGLDLKKNDTGEYTEIVGLNKDPKNVYSVVTSDGGPAIRISGEIFGALITKEEYGNYHFRCDFKWGKDTWEPRKSLRMDSGILYHSTGEFGRVGGLWMESLECQVMEHDCGDLYSVGGRAIVSVEGELKDGKPPVVYKKGGAKHTVPSMGSGRVVRLKENEKPKGEWNTMEVLCVGGASMHVTNGIVELVLTDIRRKDGDRETPLTKGKIQLQSEGAEVFYRNLQIKPIKEFPEGYRP